MDPASTGEEVPSADTGGNEAFQLLSDETRIGILRVLWDANDRGSRRPYGSRTSASASASMIPAG